MTTTTTTTTTILNNVCRADQAFIFTIGLRQINFIVCLLIHERKTASSNPERQYVVRINKEGIARSKLIRTEKQGIIIIRIENLFF